MHATRSTIGPGGFRSLFPQEHGELYSSTGACAHGRSGQRDGLVYCQPVTSLPTLASVTSRCAFAISAKAVLASDDGATAM